MTVETYVVYRRNDGLVSFVANYLPKDTDINTFTEVAKEPGYIAAWDRMLRERKVEGSW